MIHDAVDFGLEVRRQYVPRHIQMPETKTDVEVLHHEYDNLTTASSKNAATVAITESESASRNSTAQPL